MNNIKVKYQSNNFIAKAQLVLSLAYLRRYLYLYYIKFRYLYLHFTQS